MATVNGRAKPATKRTRSLVLDRDRLTPDVLAMTERELYERFGLTPPAQPVTAEAGEAHRKSGRREAPDVGRAERRLRS